MRFIVACWLSLGFFAGSVQAGSFSENFSAHNVGDTVFSNGTVLLSSTASNAAARVEDGALKELQLLQDNILGTRSAFLLPDLDPGTPVRGFSASWDAPIYGNFPNGGAGFSLTFGPVGSLNLIATGLSDVQELGYGVGLTMSVHNGTDFSPGLRLRTNGTQAVAMVGLDPAPTWGNYSSTRHTFGMIWSETRGASVLMDGVLIYTNVPLTNYVPAAGDRFVWAARAGQTYSHTYRIDNVKVVTSTNAADTLIMRSAHARSSLEAPAVVFSAEVNPCGLPTTVLMELGTNTAYGLRVTNVLLATNGFQVVTNSLAFAPERMITLHARITVSNALGTVTSGDMVIDSHRFVPTFGRSLYGGTGGNIGGVTAWLDRDNDGWLDFLVSGLQIPFELAGRFYFNPLGASPTNTIWPALNAVSGSRVGVAVGDFNNDNRPDTFFAAGKAINLDVGSEYASVAGFTDNSYLLYGADNRVSVLSTNLCIFTNYPVMGGLAAASDFDRNGQVDILFMGQKSQSVLSTNDPGRRLSLVLQNTSFGRQVPEGFNGSNYNYNWAMHERNMAVPSVSDHWAGHGDEYVGQSTLSVGDVDQDGFDDVFTLGFASSVNGPWHETNYFGLFRGQGDLGFTQLWQQRVQDDPARRLGWMLGRDTVFAGRAAASSAFADFDGDGRLDLLFTRADGLEDPDVSYNLHPRNEIWLNDGFGNLTNSGIALPPLSGASVAVGDFFNHGRTDILITGARLVYLGTFGMPVPNDYQTVLLRNDGGGSFTSIVLDEYGMVEQTGRGLAVADYDQDGRLDVLMSGLHSVRAVDIEDQQIDWLFRVLRNTMDIPSNAPPAAPSGLASTVGDGTVTFRWSPAADDFTPPNLLTYNLRVGSTTLGVDAVSPLANVTSGGRKVAAPGNVAHTTNILYRLPPGTYYWSVQAVDGAYAGGAWGVEQSFTITNAEAVRLSLGTTNSTRTLHWPVRHADFNLEQQSVLGGVWSSNITPVVDVNGQFLVPITNEPASAMFYRLRK